MRKFIILGFATSYVAGFDEEGKYYFQHFPRPEKENPAILAELREEAAKLDESNMETDDRFKVVGWTDQIYNYAESFDEMKKMVERDGGKISDDMSSLVVPGGDDSGLRFIVQDKEKDLVTETQYGLWEEVVC